MLKEVRNPKPIRVTRDLKDLIIKAGFILIKH